MNTPMHKFSEPFLSFEDLSNYDFGCNYRDLLKTVYHVPRDKMTFFNTIDFAPNQFNDKKSLPDNLQRNDNDEETFITEFWFPVNNNSSFFVYSHVFQLPLTELWEIVIANFKEIDFNPANIALIIQQKYLLLHHLLLAKPKDLQKIAAVLYEGRGRKLQQKYGID